MSEKESRDDRGMTYAGSGVNKEAGYESVRRITDAVRSTYSKFVLGDLGGFAGTVELPGGYRNPVMVSGTDGVGTKLAVAQAMGVHNTVGIDLVAMCVNDVLCTGASPLFFLDYIACARIEPEVIEKLVSGVAAGCIEAGCSLVSGETAEMPGMYIPGVYDLAGFCVGIAEKDDMAGPERVKEGDVLVALPSSGAHSNGFSMIRRILLEMAEIPLERHIPEFSRTLGEELLTPTRIYASQIASLAGRVAVHAMCHVTGGGFVENIPRMIPAGLCARVDTAAIPVPRVFDLIASAGRVSSLEMYSTFNMGAGYFMALDPVQADEALRILNSAGTGAVMAGTVVRDDSKIILAGI